MAVGSESVGCCCCCHCDIGHTLGTGELLYRRIQLQGLYTSRVTSSSPNFLNYRVINNALLLKQGEGLHLPWLTQHLSPPLVCLSPLQYLVSPEPSIQVCTERASANACSLKQEFAQGHPAGKHLRED